MSTADATTIVESLDADAIRQRLEQLGREQDALRVLLRAARARQRGQRRDSLPREGDADATH